MKNNDKYVEAKKYLQKRYPKELSDKRWNTSDINDDWVTEMMTDFASQSKPQEIPEENRQKLFNHMSTEHGLTLLESEMNSLYSICIGHEEYVKYLNWLHSKPQEIEFVKSKDQDGDDLISWKTLSGLYNIIIHNESIGVSFIPFDSNQKSQLIHHDFTRNTKTVDAVDPTFWRRLEMFVSNIQVNDMAGEEEKQYIIHVIEAIKWGQENK